MRPPFIILAIFLVLRALICFSQKLPFKKILPDISKTQQINWFYDEAVNFSQELGLARIDSGVDGFALRVWISGIGTPSDLISVWY
jgi:hypothetical protein